MSSQLSVALGSARTYLNDDAGANWPDQTLIPKMQEAHRELQIELWDAGSPIVRAISSIITIPVSFTALTPISTPPLPADLLAPFKIFEAPHSTTTFAQVTEMDFIPPTIAAGSTLGVWSWRGENIQFVGTTLTGGVDIIIEYRKLITIPVLATDLIGINFGEVYLGPRAASLAAQSQGNIQLKTEMLNIAKDSLAKVITANRGFQRAPFSPGRTTMSMPQQ